MNQTTKRVYLDNGKGQGAFGTAETWEEATRNARNHWKANFFVGDPIRVRLCERDGGLDDHHDSEWRVLVKEAPFTSWPRLAEALERDR